MPSYKEIQWYNRSWWEYVGIIILVSFTILHFLYLSTAPSGFYVDEAAGAAHVLCLQQTGLDFFGNTLQLFTPALGGGYTTAVFATFQSVWTSIVGTDIDGFRSFSAFLSVISMLGLGIIAKRWGGNTAAFLTMIFWSVSPWAFLATRIAWDPPLILPFLIWGIVFATGEKNIKNSILSGLSFGLALISYPPTKIQLFILIPLLLWFCYGSNIKKMIREQWSGGVVFLAMSLGLVWFYMTYPESLARSQMLSIFADVYWEHFRNPPAEETVGAVLQLFFTNLSSYFSWEYLFLSGDSNLRHFTGFMGMLSGFEIIGLFFAFFLLSLKKTARSHKKILVLLLGLFFSGLIPAALTWEGNPHALRSIGALPFVSLIASLSIVWSWQWGNRYVQNIIVIGMILSSIWSVLFFYDFFTQYPKRSEAYFENDVVQEYYQNNISKARFLMDQKKYDDLPKAFFLMQFERKTCEQAKDLLQN